MSHVAFGAEDERREAGFVVGDFFGLADLQEPFDHLGVCEAGVAQDGAAGLERFDYLVGLVCREAEAGCRGVDFHGAAEGLLCAGCHAGGEGRCQWEGIEILGESDSCFGSGRKGGFCMLMKGSREVE